VEETKFAAPASAKAGAHESIGYLLRIRPEWMRMGVSTVPPLFRTIDVAGQSAGEFP